MVKFGIICYYDTIFEEYSNKSDKYRLKGKIVMVKKCPECGGKDFLQGSDYVHIRPLGKKLAVGSNKIFTFCADCGEVISTRIEKPDKFKNE